MQTYFLSTSFGAKLRGGGDLKPTDLWQLNSDIEEVVELPSFAATSEEYLNEILEKQRQYNAATGNNS